MAEQDEDEFGAFLKTQDTSISTSKDIDEKLSEDDSEEDEFSQFLKKTEEPKKAPATPIAEKTEKETEVAQNGIIPEGSQEQSSPSVLPSQGTGLDSQSSVGSEPEQYSWNLDQLKFKRNISFDPVEKADLQKQIDEFQIQDAPDDRPAWERVGEQGRIDLKIATKDKVLTKEEYASAEELIESTFDEVKDDDNATDEQKEEARLLAAKQQATLVEDQRKGKERELGDLVKGTLGNVKESVGSEDNIKKGYTTFINKRKKEVADLYYVEKQVKEEYKLNEKVSDLTSYSAVRGGLANAVVPHNAYLKIANIKNAPVNSDVSFTDVSKKKEEGLAALKQEFLDQIAKDNEYLGSNLTETDLKRYALETTTIDKVAAVANSLAMRRDEVNGVKAEIQEFQEKKHKGVDGEIEDLRAKLIDEANTLNPDEKKFIEDLIIKNENLKESFFEEDGAKAEKLVNGGVKEGSVVYNAYRDILQNLPEDLSSKEKFDMFYIALEKATNKSLDDAGMLENGVYVPTVENVFRDWLGIESVMGVDFSGSMMGSLTTEEVDALQLKGKLDDLTNIFLNNTAYSSENYWDEFMSSMAEGLAPNMVRGGGDRQSDAKKSAETINTLSGLGITEGEGVNKEHLQAFNELVATPEKGVTIEKFMSTAGSSTAVMSQLITGSALLKVGKVGKVGKVVDKVTSALNKTKAGRLAVASFRSGANAEFSGKLFNDDEELAFEQFAISEIGSQAAEKLLKGVGGKLAGVFIKKMGASQKAALDFTGKILSNSAGELTDESIQTIVSAYKKSDSLKGTIEELHKQFPDMDAATEFIVLTSTMGAIFKLPISVTEVRQRLADGGYDMSKADDIIDKLGKEYKKAADIISEEAKKGTEGEEGYLTKVTDQKSPVKGGDTFTVSGVSIDGKEATEDSYKINKIDKDFNVHVTVNGKETVLSKEEFTALRRKSSFELFREFKAPVEGKKVKKETVTEPVSEVTEEAVEPVAPAEVIIDESGESKYTNKEGLFFAHTEVAKMTPEQLSDMIIKNPNAEVQANLDKAAGVEVEATEDVVEETPTEVTQEAETKTETDESVQPSETKTEDKTETVQTEEVVSEPVAEVTEKTESAGETTEQVKTEKEIKAEAKKAKADEKLEKAKKAESRNNSLVRSVESYNDLSVTKKGQTKGKAMFANIQKMSGEQGHTISRVGDKISVTDSKGKKVKTKSEFAPKADPNEWVSQEVSSQDENWAVNRVNEGVLDGEAKSGRVHLEGLRSDGLSTGEIKDGVDQIKAGKNNSVSAKRVIAALADARKKGVYEVSDGKGGLTSIPIDESTTSLEESVSKEEIDSEMESKAEEQTKAQKIQDATDSFVEAIRSKKYKPPGSLMSSVGIIELYNAAIEGIAKTIYAGGSTAAAVAKAMADIKASDWYKKKLPADRKKAEAELQADLIKRSEEINESAKIEKAKVEGTKKEAREAKKKEKKQRKNKIKDELDEAYDALSEVRDGLSNGDPVDTKKLNKHIITLLDSPNISEEVKRKLRANDDIRYTSVSNKWSQDQAIQLVKAFSEIEGGLELLLADVEGNFLKYGQVGLWILDGTTLLYQSQGRKNDATDVGIRKVKIAEILGRSFQALGITAPDNIMDAMVYTAFTETVMIQDRIKSHRDSVMEKKRGKGDVSSEEVMDDARSELTEEVGDISNHPQFKDAVEKAIAEHVEKEKKDKKEAQERADKKNTFSSKRSELKAKRKSIKKKFKEDGGNIFFSAIPGLPLLTPEGIEYAGDIAKTYIESGMLKVAEVASALKEYFKKEHGKDLSDSDILKVLKNIDVEKNIQDNKDQSSKDLADKIIDHVSKKGNKKTGDAVDVLIRNLFAKAKDSLPKQGEAESNTDYRNKLIKAMKEQTFAKEVWDSARNTVVDILDNKEANGVITGGEKGQILKDLEGLFGDEVGMPFSESLLEKSLDEQIKNDGEKINDIVKDHYSAVKKKGKGLDTTKEKARSLAEKIVADTGLSAAQADELSASLEKQFGKLIEPYVKKALAKALGAENLSQEALSKVLKSEKVTIENIIKAINLGALTEDAFLDAFSNRFGFASLTDVDAQKLNAFIYDISHLPEKSVARDKAFINFRTYMKSLELENKNWLEKYYHGAVTSFFYQHILGTASTTLRSVYGLIWGGGLQLLTEFVKNPKLFTKGLRALVTKDSNLHGSAFENFRVMGSILKGLKNLGPEIVKDAWKEGYIPYESALEGAREANTTLGVLDQLANAEWKDLSIAKKLAKLYETPGSKMLRLLFASDAVAHYAVRQGHIVTGAYNKILREGNYSSTKEKGFWEELDRRTGNTDAARKTAEAQADLELEKLKAAGVDTKNFRKKQRVEEIIFESLEDDIKIQAEQKSQEMRLGHHPKGSFGLVYDKLSKVLKFPGAMFIIPFLKIPLNLADAATDYIPVLGLKKAFFGRGNILVSAMNKTSLGSRLVSDELVKKTLSGKEFIAENRMDYLIKQGIGTAVTGALLYAVTSTFDLEDDDEDKRIEVTYKGKGSFIDNEELEESKGLKQFHFRFKYPGTNKWSGWIDYRDSPLGPILAFAGGMSDKLKYDREDYNTVVDSDEMWEAADVAKMNALFFFKEQNFLQAIGDMFKIVNNEESAGNKSKKYLADQFVRATKGVTVPSFYGQAYSWKKSLFNDYKKANVDIKDSDWALSYIVDKYSTNFPLLDHMKEDYRDNLGQKVRVNNKIPLTPDTALESFQDVVGIDSDKSSAWNYLTNGTDLKKNDIAPDVTKGRKFVYAKNDKIEIPNEVRDNFKLEYDSRVLKEYIKEFRSKGDDGKAFMKELKKDDDKYKAYLQKLRRYVYDEMLHGEKSKWRKILIK